MSLTAAQKYVSKGIIEVEWSTSAAESTPTGLTNVIGGVGWERLHIQVAGPTGGDTSWRLLGSNWVSGPFSLLESVSGGALGAIKGATEYEVLNPPPYIRANATTVTTSATTIKLNLHGIVRAP